MVSMTRPITLCDLSVAMCLHQDFASAYSNSRRIADPAIGLIWNIYLARRSMCWTTGAPDCINW